MKIFKSLFLMVVLLGAAQISMAAVTDKNPDVKVVPGMEMKSEDKGSAHMDSMKAEALEDTKFKGMAVINGTQEGSSISGTMALTDTLEGLKVTANISGLEPGDHGFHIHEFGSCGDMGKAAGGHFNPMGVEHGYLPKDGLEKAHFGDMGNIKVGEDGQGTLEVTLAHVHLFGPQGVAGRSVIVHEKTDDFGQPTGNAGGREACGTIGVVSAQ